MRKRSTFPASFFRDRGIIKKEEKKKKLCQQCGKEFENRGKICKECFEKNGGKLK